MKSCSFLSFQIVQVPFFLISPPPDFSLFRQTSYTKHKKLWFSQKPKKIVFLYRSSLFINFRSFRISCNQVRPSNNDVVDDGAFLIDQPLTGEEWNTQSLHLRFRHRRRSASSRFVIFWQRFFFSISKNRPRLDTFLVHFSLCVSLSHTRLLAVECCYFAWSAPARHTPERKAIYCVIKILIVSLPFLLRCCRCGRGGFGWNIEKNNTQRSNT